VGGRDRVLLRDLLWSSRALLPASRGFSGGHGEQWMAGSGGWTSKVFNGTAGFASEIRSGGLTCSKSTGRAGSSFDCCLHCNRDSWHTFQGGG